MEHLQRYTDLVDDPAAFLEAAGRPLPKVVWANTVRTPAETVAGWIGRRSPEARRLPWLDATWRVPAETSRAGKWPEFALGLIHTQEEVSLWPVWALDPQPGEAVLDMCAAPGSKSARIAVTMGDAGMVLANDRKWPRLQGVQDIAARMGLTSLAAACGDGAQIPGEARFDRVLVDAPCTGEGTSRKSPGRRKRDQDNEWAKMSALQKGLLRRAVELVKPGGVVVYSTCT